MRILRRMPCPHHVYRPQPPLPPLVTIDRPTTLLSRSPGGVSPCVSPGTKHHDRLAADLALGALRRSRGLAPVAAVRTMGNSPADTFHSRCAITRLVAVACPLVSTTAAPRHDTNHPDQCRRAAHTTPTVPLPTERPKPLVQ